MLLVAAPLLGVVGLGLWAAQEGTGFTNSSGCDYSPPWTVGEWLVGAAVEFTAFSGASLLIYSAWKGLRKALPASAGDPRPPLATRVLRWALLGGGFALTVYGTATHVDNWNEWRHEIAQNEAWCSFPPFDESQVPLGLAAFGTIALAHVIAAALLRRRGRL